MSSSDDELTRTNEAVYVLPMRPPLVVALGICAVLASGCKPKVKCKKMCRRVSLQCRTHILRLVYDLEPALVVHVLKIHNARTDRRICEKFCRKTAKKASEKDIRFLNSCTDKRTCKDFALCFRDALRTAGTLKLLQRLIRKVIERRTGYPTRTRRRKR